MPSLLRFSALFSFLVFAVAGEGEGSMQQRLEPNPAGQNYFSEAPTFNLGISGAAALFARQQAYVCTDPSYSVQCLAVIGKCCQSNTYCCPNNLPFCCTEGDTCEVVNGKQGCCPNSYETCDGRQCGSPGSVCCNDYNHVCDSGGDCCKAGCCSSGTKCCGDICCEAGNQCCPGANGGQGGCCYPGQTCCGDTCCNSQTQYCSSGNVCVRKTTPTVTVPSTNTNTVTLAPSVRETGSASTWRHYGSSCILVAMSLGVALELGVVF